MSTKYTAQRALEVVLACTDTGSKGEDNAETGPDHNSESEDELDL